MALKDSIDAAGVLKTWQNGQKWWDMVILENKFYRSNREAFRTSKSTKSDNLEITKGADFSTESGC